jgi:DNA-binding transcriptional LysR family regulator
VELRDLRYFLAAAEEESFTRAARRCHIAQQGLSAAIRRLERDTRQTLFVRDHSGARLTPAGALLVPRAIDILRRADEAILELDRVAVRDTSALRVGLVAPAAAELTSVILRSFRAAYPSTAVSIHQLRFDELTDALTGRQVDVCVTVGPACDARLDVVPLYVEPQVVILPRHHRLAGTCEARVSDILEETFVAGPTLPREWIGHWRLESFRGGLDPRLADPVSSDARTPSEVNEVVASGAAIVTGPQSHGRMFPHRQVACVPLVDAPGAPVAVATLARRHATLGQAFTELAAATASRLRPFLEQTFDRRARAATPDRSGLTAR